MMARSSVVDPILSYCRADDYRVCKLYESLCTRDTSSFFLFFFFFSPIRAPGLVETRTDP